jgi:hypothetical protein
MRLHWNDMQEELFLLKVQMEVNIFDEISTEIARCATKRVDPCSKFRVKRHDTSTIT